MRLTPVLTLLFQNAGLEAAGPRPERSSPPLVPQPPSAWLDAERQDGKAVSDGVKEPGRASAGCAADGVRIEELGRGAELPRPGDVPPGASVHRGTRCASRSSRLSLAGLVPGDTSAAIGPRRTLAAPGDDDSCQLCPTPLESARPLAKAAVPSKGLPEWPPCLGSAKGSRDVTDFDALC